MACPAEKQPPIIARIVRLVRGGPEKPVTSTPSVPKSDDEIRAELTKLLDEFDRYPRIGQKIPERERPKRAPNISPEQEEVRDAMDLHR